LFGLSLFTLRLPAAILSLVTLICGTIIVNNELGKKAAVVIAALLTVIPYFIMQSRFGLDCNLFLSMSTLSLCVLFKAVKTNRLIHYSISGLLFGLSLYCYATSWLIIPLFLIFFFVYITYTKKLGFSRILVFGVSLFILAWPLILFVLVHLFKWPTLEIWFFSIPRLVVFRSKEIGFQNVLVNLKKLFGVAFFSDVLTYNALPRFFTMYIISIPFAISGIGVGLVRLVRGIKKRDYTNTNVILLFLIASLLIGLLIADPNANKLNGMYYTLVFFVLVGILKLVEVLKQQRWVPYAIASLYLTSFIFFFSYYFFVYPIEVYPQPFFQEDLTSTIEQINEMNTENRPVYYDAPIIYYLLSQKVSPYDVFAEGELEKAAVIRNHYFLMLQVNDTLKKDCYYVVGQTYHTLREMLNEAGYQPILSGKYDIYHIPKD
ncbi:MAG: glycosyltransferase family 39 protein, partial [Oscillospiraceae bacterium]|nr:glycosyltransferase family 39 protein [Oscillospiraceae bacterium]